jgi:hypothetical protein
VSDWFDGGPNGSLVDVPALLDSGIPGLLADCVALGALVSLGTTSDGGSLGITVTLDGRWRRQYFRESDEATSWLLEAKDALEKAGGRQPASSAPRRRRRSTA